MDGVFFLYSFSTDVLDTQIGVWDTVTRFA
jgi:hypothetical protein